MNLKDMKIGLRLGLGFGSILILTVILVALGLFNIQKVQGLLFRVVNGDVKKLELSWAEPLVASLVATQPVIKQWGQ